MKIVLRKYLLVPPILVKAPMNAESKNNEYHI